MAASTAALNMCAENCTSAGILYELARDEMWAQWNAVADYFEYQPWIFSLIGSAMVGLSGVLPLLVIPIDEGVDLKNGAGAGTLKILLSFAVGGLLGDVFLHLLPEAWASKALNIVSSDGHRPMACGLWVLTGFLVFIIAEKIFIGEGDGEDEDEDDLQEKSVADDLRERADESLNNNDDDGDDGDQVLENNNCLTLNSGSCSNNSYSKLKYSKDAEETQPSMVGVKSRLNEAKNGYSIAHVYSRKNGYAINGATRDGCFSTEERQHNGLTKKVAPRTNGFVKNPADFTEQVILNGSLKKDSRKYETSNGKRDITTTAPVKPKAKHITGYLNLMANCIDNFTHGLAVGGSFLVSFRLGALTTFAILIHEIPHEVGDFAILLKSGFSRWDAARAQLLTASGGIIGALVAVLCSGSGIESRTSWILPFTAGGFLHIGMVTVLPELLKESNPKESAKQLGALLSGITVMAILTVLCD